MSGKSRNCERLYDWRNVWVWGWHFFSGNWIWQECPAVWSGVLWPGLCRTTGLGVDYILPLKCSISSFNWRDKFHCVQGPTETESHTETSVIHYTHITIIRIYLYQESRLHLLLIMNKNWWFSILALSQGHLSFRVI